MAARILRQADRDAIWREAAEEEGIASPTSMAPAGATPNSNKFKTPANGLKKLVDTLPPVNQSSGSPGGHPHVQEWLKKPSNAGFAKTYFKPHYQDALKTHLGDENYDKMMTHLPYEHFKSLTEHQQAPAPKSNKFTTPANGLKKLLESPHTQTTHVTDWLDKHPGFAKTYVSSPNYADALKGHLGEKSYTELKKHLEQADSKPAQTLTQESPQAQESHEKSLGDAHDQLQGDPWEQKPSAEPDKSEQKPLQGWEQWEQDLLGHPQEEKQQLGVGDKIKKLVPGTSDFLVDHLNKNPASAKESIENILKNKSYPEAHEGFQKLYQEHFGEPEPPNITPDEDLDEFFNKQFGEHPALADIKKVFPNADKAIEKMDGPQLKKQLETWLKYLPDHQGYGNHVPKLQQVYDQHFGQGATSPSAPSPEVAPAPSDKHQDLLDKINQIKPGWIKQKSWLKSQDDAGNLSNAINDWADHSGLSPEEKAGFQKLHDEYFGGGKPAPGQQWDKDQLVKFFQHLQTPGLANTTADAMFDHLGGDSQKIQEHLQKQYPNAWKKWESQNPGGQPDHTFNPAESKEIYEGWQHNEKSLPPGFKHWAEDDGVPLSGYNPNEVHNALGNGWANLSLEEKKHHAEQEQQGSEEGQAFDHNKLQEELAEGDPPYWANTKWWDGGGANGKSADDAKQFLKDLSTVDHLPEEEQAVYKKLYDKYFGQEQTQQQGHDFSKTPTYDELVSVGVFPAKAEAISKTDPEHFKKNFDIVSKDPEDYTSTGHSWGKIYNWIQNGGNSGSVNHPALTPDVLVKHFEGMTPDGGWVQKWMTKSPQQQKKDVEHFISTGKGINGKELDPSNLKKWQNVYDEMWGGGASKGGTHDFSVAPSKEQFEGFGWGPSAAVMAGKSPEELKKDYQQAKANYPEMAKTWQNFVDWVDAGGNQQGGSATPQQPPTFNPQTFADEYKKILPNSESSLGSGGVSPEKAKEKLQGLIAQYPDTPQTIKLQQLYDKWFGSGEAAPHFDINTWKPSVEDFKAMGISQTYAEIMGEKVKDGSFSYLVTQKLNDPEYSGSNNSAWGKVIQHVKKLQQGQAEQTKNSPYDPNELATTVGNALGIDPGKIHAGGIKYKDMTPEQAQISLKNVANNYPHLPELQQLYDKWFGGEQTEDSDPFAPDEPEEEEEDFTPSAPFKSEQANPEELAQWTSAKPDSGGQWKDFAKWWGKTQLSPEQEKQIYSSWFPNKNPEKAGDWLKKVFEFHSAPSGGDLEAQAIPGWAQNSWALGKNADKEWPTFAKWAQNHPGIPAGADIKQKLGIWKSLSSGDKDLLAKDYNPENPIDTKSVVSALQEAYPKSDWTKWAGMGQGTLAQNVENLAKSGYSKAIPVYNQFFGGNMEVPEEDDDKNAPTGPPPPAYTVPPDTEDLPPWVAQYLPDGLEGAKQYAALHHFATGIGLGDEVSQGVNAGHHGYPSTSMSYWGKIPKPLQKLIGQTPVDQLPFNDTEGLQQWLAEQPKPVDDLKKILPDKYWSGTWNQHPTGFGSSSQRKQVEKFLKEAYDAGDQEKVNALLGIYHKYWGGETPTLAQGLQEIYPGEDWDSYLQHTPKEQVEKDLKKKFKTETDPEKWIHLVETWNKHFTSPSGVKQITNTLKNSTPGVPIGTNSLKSLKLWKDNGGDPQATLPAYWDFPAEWDPGSYINSKASKPNNENYHLQYYGWTPSNYQGEGIKADPAMLGNSKTTQYTAPEQEKGSKHYVQLMENVVKNIAAYPKSDRQALETPEFKNWFNQAPQQYKQVFQHNPGIALDDFKAFMGGDTNEMNVPEGGSSKKKVYDVSPFAMLPKKDKNKPWGSGLSPYQHNDQRSKEVKFPHQPDEQETIPLPPGEQWAPNYNPMYLWRAMPFDLTEQPESPKQRKLLERIKEIVQGVKGKDAPPNLFSDSEQEGWAKTPPSKPHSPDEWMAFTQWAQKNNIPASQMYNLAEQYGVTDPSKFGQPPIGATPGSYDHPDLGHAILDYFEGGGRGFAPGLGNHWTRNKEKGYQPPQSIGSGANMDPNEGKRLPVMVQGLWNGLGEDTHGGGGAYHPHSVEQEHTLLSGAPVHIHRVQVKDPQGNWHDLIDHGPISMWGEGRNESNNGMNGGSGDEGMGGKETMDKPSLAQEVTKVVGTKMSGEFGKLLDGLKPGTKALHTFLDLHKKYPGHDDELAKLYQMFFVGRPDLPKPHMRYANLARITVDNTEAHLAALEDPLYSLESSIERLSAAPVMDPHHVDEDDFYDADDDPDAGEDDDLDDYEDDPDIWGEPDDEYEHDPYDPDDFNDELPLPDEPGFYTERRPNLPPGNFDRKYYSPNALNPESNSTARPGLEWMDQPPRDLTSIGQPFQDYLPTPEGHQWPHDREPNLLYRGFSVDLSHPDLGHVRRSLLGGDYEEGNQVGKGNYNNTNLAKPHPLGYDNPALGEHILKHLENQGAEFDERPGAQYGLGPHWSADSSVAQSFSNQSRTYHPLKLPVVVRSKWKGLGEDPYRTNTMGHWPEEHEVTMLPGAKMNIDSVQIQHPKTRQWHEVLPQAQDRHASHTPGDQYYKPVEARKPGMRIVPHRERFGDQ